MLPLVPDPSRYRNATSGTCSPSPVLPQWSGDSHTTYLLRYTLSMVTLSEIRQLSDSIVVRTPQDGRGRVALNDSFLKQILDRARYFMNPLTRKWISKTAGTKNLPLVHCRRES